MICAICGEKVDSNAIIKIRNIRECIIIPNGDECLTFETEKVECSHELNPIEVE